MIREPLSCLISLSFFFRSGWRPRLLRWLAPLMALLLWSSIVAAQTSPRWPLWESFRLQAIQSDGRVIERRADDRTTSEGQAYALFFALVANDRSQFQQLLAWTQNNLARGDLRSRQPAWLWGEVSDADTQMASYWGVIDDNPAADADLWLAYTLIQAGRLWKHAEYTDIGLSLLRQIRTHQQVELTGFGPSILPGQRGFALGESRWRLNPSYLMPQQLRLFARVDPAGPWGAMVRSLPSLLRQSSPVGLVPDWTVYDANRGWLPDVVSSPVGSYDAIRVYLWVGMMSDADSLRPALLHSLRGMRRTLQRGSTELEIVDTRTGSARGKTPAGFKAALLPYLAVQHEWRLLQGLRSTLQASEATALYSAKSQYYDQILALFGLGFMENRFRFDAQGDLITLWFSDTAAR